MSDFEQDYDLIKKNSNILKSSLSTNYCEKSGCGSLIKQTSNKKSKISHNFASFIEEKKYQELTPQYLQNSSNFEENYFSGGLDVKNHYFYQNISPKNLLESNPAEMKSNNLIKKCKSSVTNLSGPNENIRLENDDLEIFKTKTSEFENIRKKINTKDEEDFNKKYEEYNRMRQMKRVNNYYGISDFKNYTKTNNVNNEKFESDSDSYDEGIENNLNKEVKSKEIESINLFFVISRQLLSKYGINLDEKESNFSKISSKSSNFNFHNIINNQVVYSIKLSCNNNLTMGEILKTSITSINKLLQELETNLKLRDTNYSLRPSKKNGLPNFSLPSKIFI